MVTRVVLANPLIPSGPKWMVFLVTPRSVTPRSTTLVCPCTVPRSYWLVVVVVVVVWVVANSPYPSPVVWAPKATCGLSGLVE